MSLLNLIVAVGIMTVGIGTATLMVVNQGEQRTALAAQSQRASYATFQADVASHGIDPAGIVNPLASAANPREGSASTDLDEVQSKTTSDASRRGGSETNTLSVALPTQTGERTGSIGSQIVATGTSSTGSIATTQLAAPQVALTSPILTGASFPATGWFAFPANPPGTVYRYTTDGTDPTTASPVWSVVAAQGITVANFPSVIRVRAFHSASQFTPSAIVSTGSLTYTLSAPTFGRVSTPAVAANVVTYAEQFTTPNLIRLTPSANDSGITNTIYYTTDGSNPATSSTRTAYSAPFSVPLANWSWNNVEGNPATATIRAVAISSSARYASSTVSVTALTNQPRKLSAPTFSLAETGTYAIGQSVTLSHSDQATSNAPVIRYERLNTPTATSPSATTFTLN